MIELIFETAVLLVRFFIALVLQGLIFQPIYWLGWCVLKTFSLGKLPKKIHDDYHWSEILCWIIGLVIIVSIWLSISFY